MGGVTSWRGSWGGYDTVAQHGAQLLGAARQPDVLELRIEFLGHLSDSRTADDLGCAAFDLALGSHRALRAVGAGGLLPFDRPVVDPVMDPVALARARRTGMPQQRLSTAALVKMLASVLGMTRR